MSEIEEVVTEEDNKMLLEPPNKKEVLEAQVASNLHAAPGTERITGLLYKVCWDTLGDALTDVVTVVSNGEPPTVSMRTAMMVFGSKPKKAQSLKPQDKRRISLLNCDFKLIENVEARRFKKLTTHCLSPLHYVGCSNRRIHHGIY